MTITYKTREGDTIDFIVHQVYGVIFGVIEEVMALNPQLVNYPLVLPQGVDIQLPEPDEIELVTQEERVSLWN